MAIFPTWPKQRFLVDVTRLTSASDNHFVEGEGESSSSAPLLPVVTIGARGCFDHDAVDTTRQALANALFPLYEKIMRLSPQEPPSAASNANGSSSSAEVQKFRPVQSNLYRAGLE